MAEVCLEDGVQREKGIEKISVALNHLISISYLSVVTLVTVELLIIINLLTHNSIPIWILFSSLWLGHTLLAVIVFYSVKDVCISLESDKKITSQSSADPRPTKRWHISNEKIIPLIQYLIYCLLRLLWASLAILLAEILVYLSFFSIVPEFSFLVPIYILAGCSVFSAIICRSTSLSLSISWCLVVVTAVLLNVEIVYPSVISYSTVMIPTYILIGFWMIICIYIFFCYSCGFHKLKAEQLEMTILFFISLLLFLIADIGLGKILMKSEYISVGNNIFVMSILLVGSIFFSCWLVLYVETSVKIAFKRLGAEKPKSLLRSEEGFWVISERFNNFSGVDMIIGDFGDYPAKSNDIDIDNENDSKKCGQPIVDFALYCIEKLSMCGCETSQPQSEEIYSTHFSTRYIRLYGSTNTSTGNSPKEPLLSSYSP